MQSNLDSIISWSLQNHMKLNPKKTKEMRILIIVTKASKRLYIIRILRRNGVPVEDLIEIYFALIRSVLEYCIVVLFGIMHCHYIWLNS